MQNCKDRLNLSLMRSICKLKATAYVLYHQLWACLRISPTRQIVFSRFDAWEPIIRWGFKGTRHHIHFLPLNPKLPLPSANLIVPLTIDAMLALAQSPHHGKMQSLIPVPSLTCLRLCNDKYRFNQVLQLLGFGRYLPSTQMPLTLPYVLKRKVDEYGSHSHIIKTQEQEAALLANQNPDDYFRQTLITGRDEYATHILFKDGRIVASLSFRNRFEGSAYIFGLHQKESYKMLCQTPADRLALFARILRAIGYEGLCCFDYKLVDGEPRIFELNPRMGGSLCRFFFAFVNRL